MVDAVTTATKTIVELVHFTPENPRAKKMFDALRVAAPAAGVDLIDRSDYGGNVKLLMLWGPGNPQRDQVLRQHVAAGGHVLAWDLAYWDRDHKARVSIDAAHPQHWVMKKDLPSSRLEADRITCTDDWNPKGPIIIAGLGQKARVQYGPTRVDGWEADMMRVCRARWTQPVVYRRKRPDVPVPLWATLKIGGPIDDALRGASLVITWHSNVAVDAIRMGIPVICRDGAAAAVCDAELGPGQPVPLSSDVRRRFLSNLAWFQWAPAEAGAFWRWAQETVA
jgi:hypothetical protein